MINKNVVASGHPDTSAAAIETLKAGGNAFDAVIAATFTACVTEPMLCSLGGGGFLMTRPTNAKPQLVDFFTQTPGERLAGQLDFYPIEGDFGEHVQEFHIGLGSMAVPGCVKGLLHVHQRHAILPLSELIQPALAAARSQLRLNAMQAYTLRILAPIISAGDACRERFMPGGSALAEGQTYSMPEFADFLETLAKEGGQFFYGGAPAQRMVNDCKERGGHLQMQDLENYQVIEREPLCFEFLGNRIWSNPAPSSGGLMIALACQAFETLAKDSGITPVQQTQFARHIVAAQDVSNSIRHSKQPVATDCLNNPEMADKLRRIAEALPYFNRGTTHISVIDADANIAGLTISNGEGCGYMIPETGIIMNNMLGEQDLNPDGFNRWPRNQRISSMMAPTLSRNRQGQLTIMGSGGSNRIRSALFQVLCRQFFLNESLQQSIQGARLHVEEDHLSIELPGWNEETIRQLESLLPSHRLWPEQNLFFGGVNAAQVDVESGTVRGFGDLRRGGHSICC